MTPLTHLVPCSSTASKPASPPGYPARALREFKPLIELGIFVGVLGVRDFGSRVWAMGGLGVLKLKISPAGNPQW